MLTVGGDLLGVLSGDRRGDDNDIIDLGRDFGGLGARLRATGVPVRGGLPLRKMVLADGCSEAFEIGFDPSFSGFGRGAGRCAGCGAALRASKRDRSEETGFCNIEISLSREIRGNTAVLQWKHRPPLPHPCPPYRIRPVLISRHIVRHWLSAHARPALAHGQRRLLYDLRRT